MQSLAGTLDKFQIGMSPDGRSCMMMFVDDDRHTTHCVVDFTQFQALISKLTSAAGEMARRRASPGEESEEAASHAGPACGTLNVAFAEFQRSPSDQYIEGALISDSGEIVGIRMCPEVACQLTKAMLQTAPAASRC